MKIEFDTPIQYSDKDKRYLRMIVLRAEDEYSRVIGTRPLKDFTFRYTSKNITLDDGRPGNEQYRKEEKLVVMVAPPPGLNAYDVRLFSGTVSHGVGHAFIDQVLGWRECWNLIHYAQNHVDMYPDSPFVVLKTYHGLYERLFLRAPMTIQLYDMVFILGERDKIMGEVARGAAVPGRHRYV
jgi:hypothetical protein